MVNKLNVKFHTYKLKKRWKMPYDMSQNIKEARVLMDKTLKLLREELKTALGRKNGSREVAVAITQLENSSMWVNRIRFSDLDYSPLGYTKEVEDTPNEI